MATTITLAENTELQVDTDPASAAAILGGVALYGFVEVTLSDGVTVHIRPENVLYLRSTP